MSTHLGSASDRAAVSVIDHSTASDPHRFTLREYSFDLEEEKLQERKQLSVYKNEQYVIQTSNLSPAFCGNGSVYN